MELHNIDESWEAGRDAAGNIQSNDRFPDLKALGEYVHGKGLKYGMHSSPGPKDCGGFTGAYRHEAQDARRWAEWGFDFVKYDWCSYGRIAKDAKAAGAEGFKKPYRLMGDLLKQQDRDMVFSLCEYGMGNVWELGAQVGGHCWRTTGDITDTWAGKGKAWENSVSSIGFSQAGKEKFAGPGHWNDPDMLVVGFIGWGASQHRTRLTPNEQYTHISLWCLLSAPLLIGCDMTQFDDFTLSLLTNDEVLDVNQDPLGRQAAPVANLEVWAKDMEDGSKAVGLFVSVL
jgi:alpha-galactosidase